MGGGPRKLWNEGGQTWPEARELDRILVLDSHAPTPRPRFIYDLPSLSLTDDTEISVQSWIHGVIMSLM